MGEPQRHQGRPVVGVDGNWACSQCQNVNYGVREVCNRCQAPRPVEDDLSQAYVWTDAGIDNLQKHSILGKYGNPASGDTVPPELLRSMDVPLNLRRGLLAAKVQQKNERRRVLDVSEIPDGIKIAPSGFKDGDWICPECKNHNYANKEYCHACQAKRFKKTRFCKHAMRGYCRQKIECPFAHSARELASKELADGC